ncbi:hypothetical protein BJF79_40950 [Actinomadura sp. CNU-125]|uniref:WXG100 family type VII secretion target n=1 Tax=Actinomadura sp. CNU-125 TaxID=1904961 RepID=UPI00096445EE|nr:hypothetical protein [Actinomadura sp. CNU-125]OLT29228.1 hypothetical protein BJF79_40950 [Actinomadura sp. CNU-125]
MAEEIPGGFRIDLGTLRTAITGVTAEQTAISADLDEIGLKTKGLSSDWNSPAFGTFEEVRTWFDKASADVLDLLGDLIVRMETSYDNYAAAESGNVGNLTT